jgi:hypothetical protein
MNTQATGDTSGNQAKPGGEIFRSATRARECLVNASELGRQLNEIVSY